ncbi:MAG: hypothetical protein Q7T58_07405 [Methylotenera sp.]|nr:hypothetical protein [Methylotenera sp.]
MSKLTNAKCDVANKFFILQGRKDDYAIILEYDTRSFLIDEGNLDASIKAATLTLGVFKSFWQEITGRIPHAQNWAVMTPTCRSKHPFEFEIVNSQIDNYLRDNLFEVDLFAKSIINSFT